MMDEKRGMFDLHIHKERSSQIVMETRRQVQREPEKEPAKLTSTNGYYVTPSNGSQAGVGRSQKTYTTQLDVVDHKYHNDTLHGKAGLLYEVGNGQREG